MREIKTRKIKRTDTPTYYVYSHQHKGKPFSEALAKSNLRKSKRPNIVLFDKDWGSVTYGQPHPIAKRLHDAGSTIILYPHSPLPPWWYDGIVPVRDFTSCIFVVGQNQKKAMEYISQKTRVEICGWPWCEQKPFFSTGVENILFAPTHPARGDLRIEAQIANKNIQEELVKIGANVTCRYIGELEDQGLRHIDGWTWKKSEPDGCYDDIDKSDLVIAEGTFMYLAIARGKPTIGINQHLPIRPNCKINPNPPKNWSKYAHLLAYPINYRKGHLLRLIDWAWKEEQSEWRENLIGENMNYRNFTRTVLEVYKGEKSQ